MLLAVLLLVGPGPLEWSVSVCEAKRHNSAASAKTIATNRHRSSKQEAKGATPSSGGRGKTKKRAKKLITASAETRDVSPDERGGAGSKRGTRTTGAGSRSIRNRSIFAPPPPQQQQNLDSKSLRKATLAALAGEITASSSPSLSNVAGTDDSVMPGSSSSDAMMATGGDRRQVLHAKLSHSRGLLFRISPNQAKDSDGDQGDGARIVSLTARSSNREMTIPDGIASQRGIDAHIVRDDDDSNNDDTAFSSTSGWIPIEGIYGIYSLPSGPHAVLITRSEEAYSSPPTRPRDENGIGVGDSPLLKFRRIVSMEIVPVPTKGGSTTLSDASVPQRKSEERQLRLLRRSFREHDLYFVPSSGGGKDSDGNENTRGPLVADVTHPLQRSFVNMIARKYNPASSRTTKWWHTIVDDKDDGAEDSPYRPDSRFFWNEEHLKPLLGPISINAGDKNSPYALILDWTFPVTSAFLGVQRSITTSADTKEGKQSGAEPTVLYDELLISRRSKYRAGTRFTRRGADGTGAVTNYAETEQICLVLEASCASDGNAEYLEEIYSHVQTRGSIPLRWSSPADVKTYRPRVLIGTDPLAQARALRNHLDEQMRLYSTPSLKDYSNNPPLSLRKESVKLSFVNLIDKHSDQGRLGRAFDSVLRAVLDVYSSDSSTNEDIDSDIEGTCNSVANMSSSSSSGGASSTISSPSSDLSLSDGAVNHVWFDFHAECKGGRWNKLESLLRELNPVLDKQGYFCAVPTAPCGDAHSGWQILNVQDGVVRTNCMDCLDRTNVVQSIFGRYILYKQLQERPGLKHRRNSVSVDGSTPSIRRSLPMGYVVAFRRNALKLPWQQGEISHRLLWADNADAISRLYAGTPALKGDFTRTGKRTKRGALDDGINSLQRYYLNNFIDADRQEGMDLLVGHESFAIVDDTDVDNEKIASDPVLRGTDGKNAFRKMLLFGSDSLEPSNVVAGKALRRGLLSMGSDSTSDVSDANGGNPLELDFNWLPGDLKSHMRSSVVLAEERRSALLKSIDSRSSRDLPWWVREDATSDDETVGGSSGGEDVSTISAAGAPQTENPVLPSSGHLLGTLVAVSRAPLATALSIVCVLSTGILSNMAHASSHENSVDESDGGE